MKENKHIFSLFWEKTTQNMSRSSWIIDDPALLHRIVTVLRLTAKDELILFDREHHSLVEITDITKKNMLVTKKTMSPNRTYSPGITFFLPLLKTEHLEDAVYSLAESGVSHIQLIVTDKVHSKRYTDQMHSRLEKIIIAAAEQSKCYAFAQLSKPIHLGAIFQNYSHIDLFLQCNVDGKHISSMIDTITKKRSIGLIVGPEGDLTTEEKEKLQEHSVVLLCLTPTILRASKAAALAAGIIRSLDYD